MTMTAKEITALVAHVDGALNRQPQNPATPDVWRSVFPASYGLEECCAAVDEIVRSNPRMFSITPGEIIAEVQRVRALTPPPALGSSARLTAVELADLRKLAAWRVESDRQQGKPGPSVDEYVARWAAERHIRPPVDAALGHRCDPCQVPMMGLPCGICRICKPGHRCQPDWAKINQRERPGERPAPEPVYGTWRGPVRDSDMIPGVDY